jgi:hypothetical protein
LADVFQGVDLDVDELLRAEVERRPTVGGRSDAVTRIGGLVSLTDERG